MFQHANQLLARNCLLIMVVSTQAVPICFGQSTKGENGTQNSIGQKKSDVKPSRDQFDQAIAAPQGKSISPAAILRTENEVSSIQFSNNHDQDSLCIVNRIVISDCVVAGERGKTSASTDCNGSVSFAVLGTLTAACLRSVLPTECVFFSLSRSFPERRDQFRLDAWSQPIRDTIADAGVFVFAGIELSNRFGALRQTYLAVRCLADELDQAH